jgi:hypothetical protein
MVLADFVLDEIISIYQLKHRVLSSLYAYRALIPLTDVSAANRASTMCRTEDNAITQGKYPVKDAVVERSR